MLEMECEAKFKIIFGFIGKAKHIFLDQTWANNLMDVLKWKIIQFL